MLENVRLARRFYALMALLLVTVLVAVVHLGFLLDIPYVPTMLLFKLPALFVATLLYLLALVSLWNVRLTRAILRQHARCSGSGGSE